MAKKKKMGRPVSGIPQGKTVAFHCKSEHFNWIADLSRKKQLSPMMNHLINLERTYGRGLPDKQ